MREYDIEVEETLKRIYTIEAATAEEAKKTIEKMYDRGEIVLTADDFAYVDFYFMD